MNIASMKSRLGLVWLIAGSLATTAFGDLITWEIADGGNGHTYEHVLGPITWDDAFAEAVARDLSGVDGHLVTITSAAEQAFVFDYVFAPSGVFTAHIGGVQPPGSIEPAGGWSWVTGEAWDYTNWRSGEPNHDGPGPENVAEFLSTGVWNDIISDRVRDGGYIVEYETTSTVPLPPAALMGIGLMAGIGLLRRFRGRGRSAQA